MKHLKFANAEQMPILGLGTWKSGPGEVYPAVKEALKCGYRHIDCAFIYGNQAEIGRAVNDACAEGIVSREQLWITSKLWNDCHAPEDVQPALEQTLEELQTDYLDLYLMHWPVAHKKGCYLPKAPEDMIPLADLPLATTWKALEQLRDKGLCRHIGVANFSVPKLRALVDNARYKPEMNQIELHPYLQQPEMFNFCRRNGIHLTAYASLGSPDRPERLKDKDEPALLEEPVILEIAGQRQVTPAQVLLSWAIHLGAAVIPKSVNPERMRQNLAAVDLSLSQEELQQIARLDRHRRYVHGRSWALEGGSGYSLQTLWDE